MAESEQIERPDGRVDLREDVVLDDPALYNEDLAPTKVERRTWSTYTFAALWISMAHCIPTYMLASGLIAAGMTWRQALVTILLGNTIVLVPILLNSHPGTKYGIPFPVFARAAYGVFGANVPAVMRALVACGWFGINTWIGGQALQTFFRSLWPGWATMLGSGSTACVLSLPPVPPPETLSAREAITLAFADFQAGKIDSIFGPPLPPRLCSGYLDWTFAGHAPTEWISFLVFWGINILIVYKGMELVRKVENIAAPYVLVMTAILVVWAVAKARGLYLTRIEADPNAPRDFWSTIGPVMREPGKFDTLAKFWPVFVPSVTAMIGFWSTLSLNMPDFTRFGKSQREQAVGQIVALPTTMTVFALMGIVITSASEEIYGQAIWDPVELVGRFENRLLVAIAMFTVVVATLGVNIAANVVSPANDFANVKPGAISFKTGGLITGVLGILMIPWKLIADPNGYIFKWLLGYSGGLGSIAGVLVCDYWLVRRKQLRLADLYRRDGVYAFRGSGFNTAAIVATAAGCVFAWIGLVVEPLAVLYDYAWFVGAGGAALVYWLMMRKDVVTASKP